MRVRKAMENQMLSIIIIALAVIIAVAVCSIFWFYKQVVDYLVLIIAAYAALDCFLGWVNNKKEKKNLICKMVYVLSVIWYSGIVVLRPIRNVFAVCANRIGMTPMYTFFNNKEAFFYVGWMIYLAAQTVFVCRSPEDKQVTKATNTSQNTIENRSIIER